MKSQKVIFQIITETARLLGTELGTDNSQCGGYKTRLWNWMNSYWMFWIDCLSRWFSASSFCDFWKVTVCNFIAFSLLFGKSNLIIFQMCFIRRTIPFMCLNMINFDAVDFNESRCEEVISFFWRSVYMFKIATVSTLLHVFLGIPR